MCNRNRLARVFLLICINTLLSCKKEELGIFFPEFTIEKKNYTELEMEVLQLVNSYRASNSLGQLKRSDTISSVALTHSSYMARTDLVNHSDFNQRSAYLRMYTKSKYVGENVAFGFGTSKGVVYGWINSKKHRKILDNHSINQIGISVEKNLAGRNYFTLIVSSTIESDYNN